MEREARQGHLTDDELFGFALPPAGEPEALPPHLLQCGACGRALQEWKAAIRELAAEDVEPITRRTAEDWRAAEDRTLAALRRHRPHRRSRALPWALGVAASILLAVLLLPVHRPAATVSPAGHGAELTGQDAADDALLRDVARLSRGDDANSLDGLAPDPSAAPAEDAPL